MGSNRREASKARVLRQISEAVEGQSVPVSLCLQFEFGLISELGADQIEIAPDETGLFAVAGKLPCALSQLGPNHFTRDDDFHPAVCLSPLARAVVRHGVGLAHADSGYRVFLQPLLDDKVVHRVRTLL
jgi:hypothetical protein